MELTLAEMAAAAGRIPLGDLTRRLLALEERLGGAPPATSTAPSSNTPKKKTAPPPKKASPPPRSAETVASGDAEEIWGACLDALKEKSMPLWGIFQTAKAVGIAEDGSLILHPMSPIVRERLAEPRTEALLSEALSTLGMKRPRVVLEGEERSARSARPPVQQPEKAEEKPQDRAETKAEPKAEPKAESKTDEEAKENEASEDTRSMGQIFKDEPMLQKALDMFDGEVLP